MSVLNLVAEYSQYAVVLAWRLFQLAGLALGAWALVDTLLQRSEHFAAAGKRTKGFWIGVNAAGLAVVALMGSASMLGLLGFVANAVYLTDVRPALNLYKPVRVRAQVRRPDNRDGRGRSGGRR
ncbi:DUF2516 family protein [Actinomyces faecalis]|uniref:DUF2516 family protein n=1 Tax=Actinomyces faecalis TaxID=2722820 RepID=UPI0015555A81|nr:DUF2516 family protein [Actinomyces faecalis]